MYVEVLQLLDNTKQTYQDGRLKSTKLYGSSVNNLLLPEGQFSERHKAKYIFDVYKCHNLVDKPGLLIEDTTSEESQKKKSVYISITFAGLCVKTSTKKNASVLEFNERLTIADLFPPLCQTIKIEACVGKTVLSQKQIGLKHISNDKDEGFLPTLGPIYLHLYSRNPLEGYAGSILMSITTELVTTVISDMKIETKIEALLPLHEVDGELVGKLAEQFLTNPSLEETDRLNYSVQFKNLEVNGNIFLSNKFMGKNYSKLLKSILYH
uniref:Otoferlin-like n=1 Tax=Diabrotica virgifera virgifera TaxID=50390 RepID=A0A6P7GV84_DIAVI